MVLAIFSLLAILLSHDMTQSLACTVIESGSNERRACQFPFTINGQTYDNCTRQHDPDRKPWCSTKVMNGYHVSGGKQIKLQFIQVLDILLKFYHR